jgi:hypothetical protein
MGWPRAAGRLRPRQLLGAPVVLMRRLRRRLAPLEQSVLTRAGAAPAAPFLWTSPCVG